MRVFLTLFLTVILQQFAQAQWQPTSFSTFGDGEGVFGEVISSDVFPNGDLLIAGRYRGLLDHDPDSVAAELLFSSNSQGEISLARFTQSGELLWLRTIRSRRRVDLVGCRIVVFVELAR